MLKNLLKNLINNNTTDKDTTHSYLEPCEDFFQEKKNDEVKLLEIGVGAGGSIKLWRDYFAKGIIHGVDTSDESTIREGGYKESRKSEIAYEN